MKTVEKLKSTKGLGTRYGKKLKMKVSKIQEESRKYHKCPYCNYVAVKRVAAGIWFCNKCDSKFTGKAYSVKKKISFDADSHEIVDEKEVIIKSEIKEDLDEEKEEAKA